MKRFIIGILILFLVFLAVGFLLAATTGLSDTPIHYIAYLSGVLAFCGILIKMRSSRKSKTPLCDIGGAIVVVFVLPFVGRFVAGGYQSATSFSQIAASLHFRIAIIALIIGIIMILIGDDIADDTKLE